MCAAIFFFNTTIKLPQYSTYIGTIYNMYVVYKKVCYILAKIFIMRSLCARRKTMIYYASDAKHYELNTHAFVRKLSSFCVHRKRRLVCIIYQWRVQIFAVVIDVTFQLFLVIAVRFLYSSSYVCVCCI